MRPVSRLGCERGHRLPDLPRRRWIATSLRRLQEGQADRNPRRAEWRRIQEVEVGFVQRAERGCPSEYAMWTRKGRLCRLVFGVRHRCKGPMSFLRKRLSLFVAVPADGDRAWRRRRRQVRESGSYLLVLRWINISSSDLDKQTQCRSYHPGRTTPLGLLAGRRGALRTEGWSCLGFASANPKHPGPW